MKMKPPSTISACCAALLLALPASAAAKEKATPEASASPMAKPKAIAFHGKVAAIDASAKTFTVGKRTFTVTDATQITKEGAAATMSDLAVGEKASGSYWKKEGGVLEAKSVKIGTKVEASDPAPDAQKKRRQGKQRSQPELVA